MGWLLGLVQRSNGHPVGHRTTSPYHIGFFVSIMVPGLAVTCCALVGLMLWDGGLVMVAPAQIWNPLRASEPFSATIRQTIRLAHSVLGPSSCSHGARSTCYGCGCLRSTLTPDFLPSISFCLTIAPLRLSNVGYS